MANPRRLIQLKSIAALIPPIRSAGCSGSHLRVWYKRTGDHLGYCYSRVEESERDPGERNTWWAVECRIRKIRKVS